MGAVYLAAQFSGRQPATVALDVGLSAIRAIGLLLVLFWGHEFVGKEIERRTLFVSLTYPLPRGAFLAGRYFGLLALLVPALAVLGLLLTGTVHLAGHDYLQATPISLGPAFWLTLAYIALDLTVIAAFGILVSALSTTPFLPLAMGLAFALAARSLGPALDYVLANLDAPHEANQTLLPILDTARWLMPDLSRLDIRPLTLYGHWPSPDVLSFGALMAISYSGLMLALSVWAFKRRQFN